MTKIQLTNPFCGSNEIGTITSAEVKYIGYGVFMPVLVLLLAHSVLAVASVQLLVFLIQRSINKKRAVDTLKLAGFTALTGVSAFVILALT